jgi:hypothetical protein
MRMHYLPQHLTPLIYTSILLALTTLIVAAVNILSTPALWIIPAAFLITISCHITTLVVCHLDHHNTERIFSFTKVAWVVGSTFVWTLSLGVSVIFTAIKTTKDVQLGHPITIGHWLLVVASVLTFAEVVLLWCITVITRKERKKITYHAKWQRSDTSSSSQSWRYV